ncbi:hypothetical protein [Sciscionella marina]|uniref:hypothetical protein n=1 Tax=Sciscionella marina TaxID=508770 RepID=UPI0003A1637B|nr:hypothetical protein [Sciscionella marina]
MNEVAARLSGVSQEDTTADWDELMSVNARGTFLHAREVFRPGVVETDMLDDFRADSREYLCSFGDARPWAMPHNPKRWPR